METGSSNRENFENIYSEIRYREQRIYTDDEVAVLPEISVNHVHSTEWQLRKKSAEKLVEYLKKKNKELNILEVGCGNGWLSAKLAGIENATVTGIDINRLELNQATSVFRNKGNLSFEYGDIRDAAFAEKKFDIIVFASSIQYFPSLFQILNTACSLIPSDGEIHILDTRFYSDNDVDTARQRSKEYFDLSGFPEMDAFYFHHKMSGLHHFKFQILYDPNTFINKFIKNNSPFYWLSIFPKNQ